jgi:curved DNA-binding protein CbpA
MATMPDHYALLNVAPDAHVETIRLAYRALAQQHHPDHPGGSTESMIALNKAWAGLRDRTGREAYDRSRRDTRLAASERPVKASQPPSASESGPLARRTMASEPATRALDFGRYAGWSLSDLARHDPNYLEWLAAAPVGRSFAADINRLLDRDRPAQGAPARERPSAA